MGEIKSTLDIVMEKTRHLCLSHEEKQEQNFQEFGKKLRGLVQKFQDEAMGLAFLKKELRGLEKDYGISDKKMFINEIADRLAPDQDNSLLLVLLNDVCGLNPDRLESILNEYQDEIQAITHKRSQETKASLAKEHFISGNAVVPNLAADQIWIAAAQDAKVKFDQLMRQEKSRMSKDI